MIHRHERRDVHLFRVLVDPGLIGFTPHRLQHVDLLLAPGDIVDFGQNDCGEVVFLVVIDEEDVQRAEVVPEVA